MSPKNVAFRLIIVSAALILLTAVCHPPVPITLREDNYSCAWNQGGGSSTRNAYYNTTSSGYPTPVWRKSLKTPLIVDPTAASGLIFVPTTNSEIAILSLADGTRMGKISFKGPIPAPIGIVDSLIVVNQDGRQMIIQNWVDRKRVWEVNLKGTDFEPLISQKRVYWQDGSDIFHCFEVIEGKRVWEKKLDYSLISPAAANDSALILAGSGPIVECLSPNDGHSIWKVDMTARVRNSLEIVGDAIIYCLVDGNIGELSLKDGSKIWEVPTGSNLIASPASDGEGVYFGTSDGRFMGLDFKTGAVIWQHEIGSPVKGGATIFGDIVAFVSLNHKVYFVDKKDGTIRSEFETKGMISARPIACSDRIFVAGEDKNLYCFQVTVQ